MSDCKHKGVQLAQDGSGIIYCPDCGDEFLAVKDLQKKITEAIREIAWPPLPTTFRSIPTSRVVLAKLIFEKVVGR